MTAQSKPRHVRFDGDDDEDANEAVPVHKGHKGRALPPTDEADEYDDEDEEGDDCEEDSAEEELLERLDVIARAVVTHEGEAIADVLADVAHSLRTLVKILHKKFK